MNKVTDKAHIIFGKEGSGRREGSSRAFSRISLLLGIMALVILLGLASSGSLPSADAAGGPVCYTVADSSDEDKNPDFNDVLALVDLDTGLATFLGQSLSTTGGDVDDIEAAEFDPDGGELFAIDASRLGVLNQLTAEFTVIGELGTCTLSGGGSFTIEDADGLAKDFTTGFWYGAAREQISAGTVPDYLFRLPLDGSGNPTTPIMPGAFGGFSCVPIPTTGLPDGPDLIDDLGFDPSDGQLYGVANGGATTPTRIVRIDKTDGSVEDLGQAENEAGVFIPDIEGFSIDETGQWLLSTGQDGNSPTTDDSIFTINPPPTGPFPTNIPAVRRAQLRGDGTLFNANNDDYDPDLSYEDWEAITCYNVKNVTASLGDYTWLDTNGDGIQDSGEMPAPGVAVTLHGSTDLTAGNGDDWEVGVLDTDAAGFYQFPLPAGNYYLEFDSTLAYTLQNQGVDDAVDSDPDPATGLTVMTTLDPGENDDTWDAGILDASVGDYVWLDSDEDGLQGVGEPGVPGVAVTIYDPGPDGQPGGGDDIFVGSTVTDVDGKYGFTVVPGDYFIEFDPTLEYTDQNAGADDAIDSDPPAGVGSGQTAVFTVAAGDSDTTWDAGLIPSSIGDYVWADLNADGLQDQDEPGVAGVQVELFDVGPDGLVGTTDDILLAAQTTDADGAYLFLVPPGEYYVRFDPARSYTTQYVGGDDTIDSNADPANGRSDKITLTGGEDDLTIDAGLLETARIGDKVWDDVNLDGIQDGGEPGVPNVTVKLIDPGPDGIPGTVDDVEIGTTTTDVNGEYNFAVAPGDYFIEFEAPAGTSFSPSGQGGDPLADSDADVSTGQTAVTTLDINENDPSWDAGIYTIEQETVAVGNIVWHDVNDDGIRNAGEAGIGGVTVNLYSTGAIPGVTAPVATTTTNSNGRYLFPNVAAGTYFVAVDSSQAALTGTPYTSEGGDGGNHQPDTAGDHPAANGDDGTEYDDAAFPWIVTQEFAVTAGGQPVTDDIEDPVNIDDASSYMTIDFGFTVTPTAIGLGLFTAQAPALPLALVGAMLLLLAASAFFILRAHSSNSRA